MQFILATVLVMIILQRTDNIFKLILSILCFQFEEEWRFFMMEFLVVFFSLILDVRMFDLLKIQIVYIFRESPLKLTAELPMITSARR